METYFEQLAQINQSEQEILDEEQNECTWKIKVTETIDKI